MNRLRTQCNRLGGWIADHPGPGIAGVLAAVLVPVLGILYRDVTRRADEHAARLARAAYVVEYRERSLDSPDTYLAASVEVTAGVVRLVDIDGVEHLLTGGTGHVRRNPDGPRLEAAR